ncbi:unnamed protein product, partial [Tetraodon nigroviridis]
EALVLINFEGNMSDELTVKMGDVVKNVTKASEEGWLQGELNGKRGIFPSNFVKVGNREPRSLRKTGTSKRSLQAVRQAEQVAHMFTTKLLLAPVCPGKKVPQIRKCEVTFAYNPVNHDELQLNVGEIIEIIREETEDEGWWEGELNGRRGFFPDNFVMVIPSKDVLQVSRVNFTLQCPHTGPALCFIF